MILTIINFSIINYYEYYYKFFEWFYIIYVILIVFLEFTFLKVFKLWSKFKICRNKSLKKETLSLIKWLQEQKLSF
jgi:hypothetical protein